MLGSSFTNLVATILSLAVAVGGAVGLVQVLMTRPDAFVAASKLTKAAWGGILGAAVVLVLAFGALGLLGLLADVAVIVYWVDVRPALRAVLGRGGRSGPYGPW